MNRSGPFKHFLVYWLPSEVDWHLRERHTFGHAISKQFRRIKPGDWLWIVTCRDGLLYLAGRMQVQDLVGSVEAGIRCDIAYDGEEGFHAFAARELERPFGNENISSIASQLEFVSPTAPRLRVLNGKVDPRQLQTIRELTADSVRVLEQLRAR